LTDKIVIPTDNQEGMDAKVAEHFGRTQYFTVVELDNGQVVNVNTVSNTSEHVGGVGSAFDQIVALNPKAVIVHGMGPRGLINFQGANVKVLRADANVVNKLIEAYIAGELEELTEGCSEAHQH
jgi:predicted Fe-Mo cluster-binding NifX family protein